MPLALSVSIFNKKSHQTRAVEIIKIWSNLESFHSSCTMTFFVENWQTESQRHEKNAFAPFSPTQLAIMAVLLHKRGDR